MSLKTRQQRRMQATWDALHARFQAEKTWRNHSEAKKYLTAVKKTPARIHTSGLGQALAFLKSRSSKEAGQDIEKLTLQLLGGTVAETDLLAKLRNADMGFYFVATEEAIAVCEWLASYLSGAGVKDEEADIAPVEEPTETASSMAPIAASDQAPAKAITQVSEAQENETAVQKEVPL